MSDFDTNNYNEAAGTDEIDDNAGNTISGGTALAVLEYVTKAIVDDPESVVVEAVETPHGTTLSVHVALDDKGKVIGKRGRVAVATRTVIRAIGARDGQNVTVDIADD